MNEIHDIYHNRPYFGYIRVTDGFNNDLNEEGD